MSNASSRIEEIRQRTAAAIRGPWFWGGNVESNTIHLATRDRGRLFLLSPDIRYEQYIYDHESAETYTVEEMRDRFTVDLKLIASKPYVEMVMEELSQLAEARGLEVVPEGLSQLAEARGLEVVPEPGESLIEDDFFDALEEYDEKHDTGPDNWWCSEVAQDAWRDFTGRDMSLEEGTRTFVIPGNVYASFTRGIQAFSDLDFAGEVPEGATNGKGEPWDRHTTGGYRMTSYRDLARYEVLEGRTIAEHEAAGGTINGEPRNLYRQDIVGIDNPEAEFIAHSRDDVDYLLGAVDEAIGVMHSLLGGDSDAYDNARDFLETRLGEVVK